MDNLESILLKPTREWTRQERAILVQGIKDYGRAALKSKRKELKKNEERKKLNE